LFILSFLKINYAVLYSLRDMPAAAVAGILTSMKEKEFAILMPANN
jgi:hypothetical protein